MYNRKRKLIIVNICIECKRKSIFFLLVVHKRMLIEAEHPSNLVKLCFRTELKQYKIVIEFS